MIGKIKAEYKKHKDLIPKIAGISLLALIVFWFLGREEKGEKANDSTAST